jgi:hypothetical protein
VQAAGRRHELPPGDEAPRRGYPLLGSPDVRRTLAGTEQATVDLADRLHAGDLAARDGGHRLVDQRHPLGHAAGDDVGMAEQRLRAELEVAASKSPRD